MRFLFISNSKHWLHPSRDASTRYRCFHPAENLRSFGHDVDICTQQAFGYQLAARYDVYIFHRPRYSRYLEMLLNLLNRRNKLVLADYDDLLFSPKFSQESPLYLNGQTSLKIVTRLHQNYQQAMRMFDHFTVSTQPLANHLLMENSHASIKVIHNGYSESWLAQAMLLPKEHASPLVGYFPGTKSHDRDFARISDQVCRYISHSNRRLMIVGPLNVSEHLLASKKLLRSSHVPYRKLSTLISRCHVSLAPLEDTAFNRCKSGIKFMESALFSAPVIATPIPDMRRFQSAGIFLAETAADFTDALHLLENNAFSDANANAIRNYALKHCSAKEQTHNFLSHINDLLGFKSQPDK